MDGVGAHADLLARLGPHTTGVGCIYIKDLELVDLAVLEQIVRNSYATLTAGTYRLAGASRAQASSTGSLAGAIRGTGLRAAARRGRIFKSLFEEAG